MPVRGLVARVCAGWNAHVWGMGCAGVRGMECTCAVIGLRGCVLDGMPVSGIGCAGVQWMECTCAVIGLRGCVPDGMPVWGIGCAG